MIDTQETIATDTENLIGITDQTRRMIFTMQLLPPPDAISGRKAPMPVHFQHPNFSLICQMNRIDDYVQII